MSTSKSLTQKYAFSISTIISILYLLIPGLLESNILKLMEFHRESPYIASVLWINLWLGTLIFVFFKEIRDFLRGDRLLYRCVKALASLKLTVFLLGMSAFLVFIGTIGQRELGIWETVNAYFRCFMGHVPFSVFLAEETAVDFKHLHFYLPGGYTVGVALLINLFSAHSLKFKLNPSKRHLVWGTLVTLAGCALLGWAIWSGIIREDIPSAYVDSYKRVLYRLLMGLGVATVLLIGCWGLFWKRAGVVLLHFGIILLLFSELITGVFSREGNMSITEGESSSSIELSRRYELAVSTPNLGAGVEQSTVVSWKKLMQKDSLIKSSELPFQVKVKRWYENSTLIDRIGKAPENVSGAHKQYLIKAEESVSGVSGTGMNMPSVEVELLDNSGKTLGSYIFTPWLRKQPISIDGKSYDVILRNEREYIYSRNSAKPLKIHLIDFRYDKYTGTTEAQNFSSLIRLIDSTKGVDRKILISMNNPLRYSGRTFYQSSFARGETGTVLQVVKNPGWMIPYMCCMIVGVGMLFQFLLTLNKFMRKFHLRKDTLSLKGGLAQKSLPLVLGVVVFFGYTASKARLSKDDAKGKVAKYLEAIEGEKQEVIPNAYAFSELPALYGGRIKPLDTIARNTLRVLADSESIYQEYVIEGKTKKIEVPPVVWLLDIISGHKRAEGYRMFRIHNLELLKKIGIEARAEDNYKYSLAQLLDDEMEFVNEKGEKEKIARYSFIYQEAYKASQKEKDDRSIYEGAVLHLRARIRAYETLKVSFFTKEFEEANVVQYYNQVSPYISENMPRAMPDASEWNTVFMADLKSFSSPEVKTTRTNMQKMFLSWEKNDYVSFNEALGAFVEAEKKIIEQARASLVEKKKALDDREANIDKELAGLSGKEYQEAKESILTWNFNNRQYLTSQEILWGVALDKAGFERFFNSFSPFYLSLVLYVLVFISACFGMLFWRTAMWKFSMSGIIVCFGVHTFAVWCRYYISGYPPVTNLYSSAVFISWGVVLAAIVIELVMKRYFALVGGAIGGFACLLIAHNLQGGEDTMEMMRAVLDSKFWLATHVVTITLGYTATFLAGGIGLVWIAGKFIGQVTKSLEKEFERAIYGLVCYGMFLSFVGTVLGGLWADDSWGRFWGWDTKENGALIIVIWNAIILHARWGGIVRMRGLAALAVFGNIVTGFSWFGVNLLSVGLHSYGFTDNGFYWIVGFSIVNFVLILPCMFSLPLWKKFAPEKANDGVPAEDADLHYSLFLLY